MLCRVLPLGPAPEETLTQREWPWYPFDRRNWGDNAGEPELRQEYESYAQGSPFGQNGGREGSSLKGHTNTNANAGRDNKSSTALSPMDPAPVERG
jgi:hypothetical protein